MIFLYEVLIKAGNLKARADCEISKGGVVIARCIFAKVRTTATVYRKGGGFFDFLCS